MEPIKEDPKEVFQTFSEVFEALLLAYHGRYPMHPANTMSMVMVDFGKWIDEFNKEPSGKDIQMIPFLEKMGVDLATRIGGHSTYQQARQALASGGDQ